jgi:FkbM family methyltransferase
MLKDLILGNKLFQPFFEFLFKVSVKGMNLDRGHIPNFSGEKFVFKFLKQQIKSNRYVVFDVGANTGQYAKITLDSFDDNLELHSFEPQPHAYNQLIKVSDSKSFNTHQLAVGKEKGELELFFNREGSVYASMYPSSYDFINISLSKSIKVPVVTLDEFCKENNIDKIHLLKIDVDGFEMEVLNGAKALLSSGKVEMIQFEFGIASIKARIFMEDFFHLLKDYRIYRILQNGIREIRYSEYAELFLTTNYLAVRK